MKLFFFSFVFLSIYSYSQVGINTDSPKNTLHVEGDTRITKIEKLDSTPTYILVPDDNNVISKIETSSISSSAFDDDSGSETKKIQTYKFNSNKTVDSGIFQFRITGPSTDSTADNGNMSYQIRMLKKPTSNVILTTAFVSRWGGNGGNVVGGNSTITFTSSNWNVFQTLGTISGDLNGHNVMLSVFFSNSSDSSSPVFYNLIAQRVDGGLKSLIINRY